MKKRRIDKTWLFLSIATPLIFASFQRGLLEGAGAYVGISIGFWAFGFDKILPKKTLNKS